MRGWLMANLFLLGLPTGAAALLFGGVKLVDALELPYETQLKAAVTVLSIIITALIARHILRRIERR